jgi:hypothetical protein
MPTLPFRAAFLAAVFAGSALAPAQETEISVACKAPSAKAKVSILRLEGAVPFPDHAVLKIGLFRSSEDYGAGHIVATTVGVGGGVVEVKGKKFVYEPPVQGPGAYQVQVAFMDEFQRPAVMEQLKGKVTKRQWKFDFMAWTDDLLPQIGPRLDEIAVFQRESLDALKRFEEATANEANWKVQQKELVDSVAKLMQKIEKSEGKAHFPAALNQLFYTVRSVHGTSPYFHWENGKFAGGKSYHADNQEIKSHRNEPYTFPNLKKYIEEAVPLAGREMALWILKDIKRAGVVRPEVQEVLKKYGTYAGLAPFAERLGTATPPDLEALEKDLRGSPLMTEPVDPKKEKK